MKEIKFIEGKLFQEVVLPTKPTTKFFNKIRTKEKIEYLRKISLCLQARMTKCLSDFNEALDLYKEGKVDMWHPCSDIFFWRDDKTSKAFDYTTYKRMYALVKDLEHIETFDSIRQMDKETKGLILKAILECPEHMSPEERVFFVNYF